MRLSTLGVSVLLIATGMAHAQGTVEFRVVEVNNQTVIRNSGGVPPNNDSVLNFAVQARVTGATARGIGSWGFDIRIPGEAEGAANGTLSRLRINNADGSYYTGAPTTSVNVALVGVASAYRYLVGIGPEFNGLINTSGGTFTNGPDQEIGLIAGYARGQNLVPSGIIVSDPGNPGAFIPATGTDFTNALDASFGADGNWIDLYRFRYSVALVNARFLNFGIENVVATTFSNLVSVDGDWAAETSGNAQIGSVTPWMIGIPAPSSGALLGFCGLLIARRRR